MDLATFRRTSQPIKSAGTYWALTDAEITAGVRDDVWDLPAGASIATPAYLRMTVTGAENVPDGGLYFLIRG